MWTVESRVFNAGMFAFISILDLQGHKDSVLHFNYNNKKNTNI